VDTTATIGKAGFRDCLERVAADEGVDAVIAVVLPTAATGDLAAAISEAEVKVPLAAVMLGQPETVRLLSRKQAGGGAVPVYGDPEDAARALGHAATYGAWRARRQEPVPQLTGLRTAGAKDVIRRFLDDVPDGGWLPARGAAELLACYGVPLAETRRASNAGAAARAAAELGCPVVLKADVPGLVHKSEAGAVKTGLRSPAEVRRAFGDLAATFGARLAGVLVQPMVTGGTEVIAGVTEDPVFGPLVLFGLGGVATEVLGDHVARLAPLTATDAEEMISGLRSAALLRGYRGSPPSNLAALREVLLRVSRLADDLPEVAELDLNPVIARPDGAWAVDARVRVAPVQHPDPFLRRLR
jgi:acyl-CoA synthetase (NDP forming)